MPYAVDWYIENEIVFIRYAGEITVDELRKSLQTTQNLIDQSSRTMVHTITDVGDVTKSVGPLESISVLREVGNGSQSGWQIIIREKSVLIKMSVAFGTSVMKARTRTFDTMEEAEAFLNEIDPALNWNKANRSLVTA